MLQIYRVLKICLTRLAFGIAAIATLNSVMIDFAHTATPQTYIDSAGFYPLLTGNMRASDPKVAEFLDHPFSAGVSARTDWGKLEPVDNQYDWSYIDEILAVAASSKKKVMLRIVSAWMSPDWVYDAGAEAFWYTEKHNNDQLSRMPVPWDAVYLRKWRDFIQALGARYNNNPNLAVIAITGASRSSEMYLPNADKDIKQWYDIGYSDQKIVNTWKTIIDEFADAFPDTALILPVSIILDNDEVTTEIVEYGTDKYPFHLATKIAYWTQASSDNYPPTAAMIAATSRSAHSGLEPAGSMQVDPAVELAIDWKTVTWIEPYDRQVDDMAKLYDEVTRHKQMVSSTCFQSFVRSNDAIRLRWANPSGYKGFSKVRILKKQGNYPESAADSAAKVLYEGNSSTSITDKDVSANTNYFYTMYELPSEYVIGHLQANPSNSGLSGSRCSSR